MAGRSRGEITVRVKAMLCVLALAAFAASSAVGENTYAKGESGPPTHHVNRGRVVDLNLDGGRLAVRYTESFSSVDSEHSFSLGGVAVSGARPTGIGTWHLLTLEESSADAPEHDARIRAMLESAEVEFVSPVFVDHDGEWMTPTPDILVRFKPDSTFDAEELFAFLVPDTTILESNFGRLSGAYRLRSAARDGFDVLEQVNRLARDPAVLWAEPDWQFSGRAGLVPNDPGFPNLWGIVNTGQFGGTPGEDMDADIAWDTTTGSPNVRILILDVGVQQDHPDINQLPGADFTGQGVGGGPVNACDNHGTAVAGIVTAIIDNALGTVGVAPGSVVVSARTFVSDTPACTGDWTSQVSWTVDALGWGELRGARVSNNSSRYGFVLQSQAIEDKYTATKANGMVHYASAGNSAIDDLTWPASLPAVNAVTAIEPSGQLASFSNFNDEISVSAPGASIYTTDRTGSDGYAFFDDYVFFGGTSAASPYAAGVAALVLSVDPTLTAEEVETLVECSARDTGVFGFDKFFGHGFVNAANAVEAAVGTDTDLDGLVDLCDNCPDDSNANQADADADGLGDVCDDCTDVDGDGFGDPSFPATTCPPDNCVSVSNALQEDSDVDGIGDACDICPQDSDPGQMDTDLDGIGDACDDCPTVPNAGFSEFVVNGGFETSDRSGWTVQTTGSGDWTINDGTFDPPGPTGTFPPISGSFDIVVNQGGGSGTRSLLQTVMLPVDITAAMLSWSDRTLNQAGSYNVPDQEFRVLLEEPGGALITGVYSTSPGDSLIQPGPNPRSFDLAVTLQAREGQQVVLNFEEQDDLNFFNVFIDDVSLSIERGAAGDADGDGAGDVCDNCEQANPLQADDDTDGVGNVCDICPADADPAQADADGDGAGDACDCRSEDPNDRAPGDVTTVTAARFGASTIELSWTAVTGADVYSVSRGILSALAAGSYGACLLEGHAPTSFQDAEVPAIGDGYFYLVQGQSYECGLGSAGFTSDEDLRQNLDAGACVGQSHTDAYPTAETSVLGTATGSFGDVTGSDDVVQAITEEETGGSPAKSTSLLEHHYNITVAPGSIVELHIEGFRTSSVDGDDFAFEYSIDGGTIWNSIAMASLPLADDDIDLTGPLPSSLSGTVLFRVVDTDRTAGNIALDTVSIDELFVRSVP